MSEDVKDDQVQNPITEQGEKGASSASQGKPTSPIPGADDEPVLVTVQLEDGTDQKVTQKQFQEMWKRHTEYDSLNEKVQKMTQDFSRVSNEAAAYRKTFGPLGDGQPRQPQPEITPGQPAPIDVNSFRLTKEDWESQNPEENITTKVNQIIDFFAGKLSETPRIDRREIINDVKAEQLREEAYQVIAADPFLAEQSQIMAPDQHSVAEHLLGTAAVLASAEMARTGNYNMRSPAQAWAWFKNHPIYGIKTQAQPSGSRQIKNIVVGLQGGDEGTPSGGGGNAGTGLAASWIRMSRREQIDWENKATREEKAQLAEEIRKLKP